MDMNDTETCLWRTEKQKKSSSVFSTSKEKVNPSKPKLNGSTTKSVSQSRESTICNTDGRSLANDERNRRSQFCPRNNEKHKIQKALECFERKMETPVEIDLSPDVKGDILDIRPTSQQNKKTKEQREILWRIRHKRPKLVIGCGGCILYDVFHGGRIDFPLQRTCCQTNGKIRTSRKSGL